MAQGCSLSPILFSVFINDLLKDVEQAELGIQLSSGKRVGGMLFADDFVGVSDSRESPQKLTSKLKILQIIMWNIGMAKETRSGCLVHIVVI